MAHLYSLFAQDTGYTEGQRSGDSVKFPGSPFFQGFNKPSRLEGEIFELEVSGKIPKDINGTFFRVQPDHRFPPVFEEDIHFNGDGAVSAFRFQNGHVDFVQKFVKTDRFKAETAARRALFGKYRNPYTDNEMVKGIVRTASNTNVYFWRGALLASKEDGPPFAMDPVTLETIGRYDFEGQIRAPTFTAHPKIDPETGEMVAFAYEAGGNGQDASCDVVVWTIDANGKKTEETWYKAPFCGMIHDCALTKNYLILPLTPIKASLDRIKTGGHHWAWDPNEDQIYGVVPRRGGKPEDIKWLRADNAFHGHVAGAWENEDGHIVVDLTVADGNVFFWWPPEEDGKKETMVKRNTLNSDTYRWILDPKAETNSRIKPAKTYGINGEFSRIDDRFVTKPYEHFWQCQIDPSRPYDFEKCGPPAGGLFNVIGHFNWKTGIKDVFWAGPTTTFQEPAFIPKDTDVEGDGYLITLLNHLDVLRNDILIFDAMDLAKGPLAVIHLPFKLKLGLHGNFVDQKEIDEWTRRRAEGGDLGPVKAAETPLQWQKDLANGYANGHTNGSNGST